jgi:hypothetical protein
MEKLRKIINGYNDAQKERRQNRSSCGCLLVTMFLFFLFFIGFMFLTTTFLGFFITI